MADQQDRAGDLIVADRLFDGCIQVRRRGKRRADGASWSGWRAERPAPGPFRPPRSGEKSSLQFPGDFLELGGQLGVFGGDAAVRRAW